MIPLLLIILFIFYKVSVGEYCLGGYFDPAYAYLFNSLNLAQFSGLGVGHIDHPGTTVQTAGAVIIKIVYTFAGSEENIATDVLKNPELYISCIVYTFIVFTGFCDFILGICSYRIFNKFSAACLFQIIPFYSATIYDHIADLSSESFLIPSVLLMLAVAISFTGKNETDKRRGRKYAILFGLVSGFGLAAKLTFFPLMVIPFFLLSKLRMRICYLSATLLSCLIFVLPALSISNIQKFSGWITGIILHSGQYGTGPQYVIHGSSFTNNLINIFTYEFQFIIVYLILVCVFCLQFIPKIKIRISGNSFPALMNGIFISITIYIIIVAKHFEYHYLIPAYMLCIPGLVISYFVYADFLPVSIIKRRSAVIYPVVVIYMAFQLMHLEYEFRHYSNLRDAKKLMEEYRIKNYRDVPIVYGTVSCKEYALLFGAGLSGAGNSVYSPLLIELYPDYICLDVYIKKFCYSDYDNFKSNLENERFIFKTEDKELVHSLEDNMKTLLNKSNIISKEVYRNGSGEMLFLITRFTEDH